jgi:Malectin domain
LSFEDLISILSGKTNSLGAIRVLKKETFLWHRKLFVPPILTMLQPRLNKRPVQATLFYYLLIAVLQQLVFAIDPIRVNAGGDTIIDPQQRKWEGDDVNKYYTTGNSYWDCPKSISNTTNDSLYCTYRWFNQAVPYRYTFPTVPNGKYTVRLHFAELYV